MALFKIDLLRREWLDVVFTGRNKAYGAYELRNSSARTTNRALIIGAAFFILVISLPTIINWIEGFVPKPVVKVKITDVTLAVPPPPDKKIPPPPPDPPKPKVDQVKFPPPVVKPDNEVKEEPPTVKELKAADPGQEKIKGDPNAEIHIDEPVGTSDTKVVTEDVNKVYESVEKEPSSPKFFDYLSHAIQYPAVDRENNVQGKVFVQFVVERDGSLTQVVAVRGPSETLKEEAVKRVKAAPKWTPGIQNGKPVRVQYTVPVNFTLNSDN